MYFDCGLSLHYLFPVAMHLVCTLYLLPTSNTSQCCSTCIVTVRIKAGYFVFIGILKLEQYNYPFPNMVDHHVLKTMSQSDACGHSSNILHPTTIFCGLTSYHISLLPQRHGIASITALAKVQHSVINVVCEYNIILCKHCYSEHTNI